jgi:hypothetical protein
MRAPMLTLILIGATVLVAAPQAMATNYEVCDPEQTVCVVQDDGSGEDQHCESDDAEYGRNDAENAVYVSVPNTDDEAHVRLHETCGHWHLHNQYRYGANAGADVQDAEVDVRWQEYQVSPNNFWNNDHEDGTRARVLVTAEGETLGVAWWEQTSGDCNTGEETHECHTEVHLGPAGEEDAGCPAGGPPSPPSPDTVPYGQVVP